MKPRSATNVDRDAIEVDDVVQRLEAVIRMVRTGDRPPDHRGPISGPRSHLVTSTARLLYWERRRRLQHFPEMERDFGEPAWDIILDLFIANRERRPVSISSACIAAEVPSTTALRWIVHLEEQEVIYREADPKDRRRWHLHLSEPVVTAMENYITDLVRGSGAG